MAAATKKDNYSNLVQVAITQSAADTLTFEEIDLGLTIFQKIGIVINRIEMYPQGPGWALLQNNGDTFIFGLTQSNQITTLSPSENAVVYRHQEYLMHYGTAGNAVPYSEPIVADFSEMPGGGLIIAPRPLFIALDSDGLGATFEGIIRMYFIIIELKADEYFELLESRRFFG